MAITNKLSAIGDAIRDMTQTTGTMKLDEMPAKIRTISVVGELPYEMMYPTDFDYLFANNAYNWIIEKYANSIHFTNLSKVGSANHMFDGCNLYDLSKLRTIDVGHSATYMFARTKAQTLPNIAGGNTGNIDYMFYASEIEEIPANYFKNITPISYVNLFTECRKLLSINEYNFPNTLRSDDNLYGVFERCSSLEEIRNLRCPSEGSGNPFRYTFNSCVSLKHLTFRKLIGTMELDPVINLSIDVGFGTNSPYYTPLEESSYNQVSAIETIRTLPTIGKTHKGTIEFKGEAGSATTGGAIKDMPKEEVAAATAKGWTVAYV